jgi:hypothetical protein
MAHILIELALKDGHIVTGVVRDPRKITLRHENLHIIKADMTDMQAVEAAVAGADVVIEGVAGYADGTKTVLAAMQNMGVKRLIAVSTYSAPDPNDGFHFGFKLVVSILSILIADPVKNVRRAARLIRGSELDWTMVRVLGLTNKPGIGRVKYGYLGREKIGYSITRADMAQAILEQLTSTTYMHKAPAVSN